MVKVFSVFSFFLISRFVHFLDRKNLFCCCCGSNPDGSDQCDQIGRFLKHLGNNFLLQKQPKYLENCLGFLKSIKFKVKIAVTTFWQLLTRLGYFLSKHLRNFVPRLRKFMSVGISIVPRLGNIQASVGFSFRFIFF